MNELKLERTFKASPDTVFAYLTQASHLLNWWGPEGMSLPQAELDFTRPGPWASVFMNAEGRRFKVTGNVVTVDPPKSVELTWAWHDEQDQRGHESRVKLMVKAGTGGGTHFTLLHTGLADEESTKSHNAGWTSSLRKLERMAA